MQLGQKWVNAYWQATDGISLTTSFFYNFICSTLHLQYLYNTLLTICLRGSRDGAVVEHSPPTQAFHVTNSIWSGFDSGTRCQMWVEFVVGSCPCSERFFSGYSGFPLSSKTYFSKFQFDLEFEGHRFVSRIVLLSVTLVK